MRPLIALERAIPCAIALAVWSCGDAGDRSEATARAGASPGEAIAMTMEASLKGLPGPALAFETLDGAVVDLAESYGRKPVYLKMWATWCGPCRRQMPHLESTYERIGNDFTVLAVATGVNETEEEVRAFVEREGLATPMAVDDGRLAGMLDLRVTPVHVVIGRDGRILHVGHLADGRLEAALREAERRPPPGGPVQGRAPDATPVLSRLPERTLETVDGEEIELARADADEPTALVFFMYWCESYFSASKPELSRRCSEMWEDVGRLQAEGGARWIGVASGLWSSAADVVGFRDDDDVAIPLVFDESGDLFESFGVTSTPVVIVFGPDGTVVARIDHARGGSDLRTALAAARERAPSR